MRPTSHYFMRFLFTCRYFTLVHVRHSIVSGVQAIRLCCTVPPSIQVLSPFQHHFLARTQQHNVRHFSCYESLLGGLRIPISDIHCNPLLTPSVTHTTRRKPKSWSYKLFSSLWGQSLVWSREGEGMDEKEGKVGKSNWRRKRDREMIDQHWAWAENARSYSQSKMLRAMLAKRARTATEDTSAMLQRKCQ